MPLPLKNENGFIKTNSSVLRRQIRFYFTHNSRGDIVGIYGGDGLLRASYEYDAWGNVLAVKDVNGNEITDPNHIGNLNPFRYRSYYYDSESGFYYLLSRYYDPVTHRFINADGYFQSGGSILDTNMSAYCGNNPVMYSDPSGMFWEEIGNWFKNVWNNIKSWTSNTFGAGASFVCTYTDEVEAVMPIVNKLVTIKTGNRTTYTESKTGNSSKPVSVYAQGRSDNLLLSSVGTKVNISNFTFKLSLGLDDISVSGSLKNGSTTNSFGIKADVSQLKVGIEMSSTVDSSELSSITDFTNVSVTAVGIFAAYEFMTTGEWDPALQPEN